LRSRWRRRGRWSRWLRRHRIEIHSTGRLLRGGRRSGRLRREALIQNRTRGARARRREREHEGEEQEDRTAPPAGLGEQVARLPRAEDRARRAGGAAKGRGHAAALAGLHENDRDQDDAVDREENEKKRVHKPLNINEFTAFGQVWQMRAQT